VDFERLLSEAKQAAVGTDWRNRVIALNPPARELLQLHGEEVEGRSLFEILDARDEAGNRLPIGSLTFWDMTQAGEAVNSFTIEAKRGSGEACRLRVSVVVFADGGAESHRLVYLLRPVLRRRRADEVVDRLLAASHSAGVELRNLRGKPSSTTLLTSRQVEVLKLISGGSSVEEVSERLGISVHTVRRHVQDILGRMAVRSQAAAVSKAFRERIL